MAKKVEYKFDPFRQTGLSRKGLTKAQQSEILDEVAEFIVDKTIQFMDKSNSPVAGERRFPKLKEDGATSTLEETGDLKDGIIVERDKNSLVTTVEEDQQGKADNHNKFSRESRKTGVLKRQFIPKKSQGYKTKIIDEMREVMRDLIEEFKDGKG